MDAKVKEAIAGNFEAVMKSGIEQQALATRAVAQAERYREALVQIDKHWRMVGGALSEHSVICTIARKALEGGE